MRVGVLTGGGDCPGLNAVIRAIVRRAEATYSDTVIGFHDGWRGVVENSWQSLDVESCRGILSRGGTILGTSRYTPFNLDNGVARALNTIQELKLDALVVIGGEGTLSCAYEMHIRGVGIVGVPKTIDNDISCTERTFGFDTAVNIATDAIDRLRTTAESHDRAIFVEVMGRNVGHIATWAGIAGGVAYILTPETPFDIQELSDALLRRKLSGRHDSIVVVAEGAQPQPETLELTEPPVDVYGHKRLGGIANVVAAEVEKRTGIETRVTILGHVQRGGTPTSFDRVLSTRFGVAAMDAVKAGCFGAMVALQANKIELVTLREATARLKPVDKDLLDVSRVFFA